MRGAILGIAVLGAALTLVAAPGVAGRSTDRHWCRQLPRWTAYYAGRAVGVHRLNEADRDCYKRRRESGLLLKADGFVSYVYGDCHASDDSGCRLPVEIQSKPLCSSRPAVYDQEYAQPDRWERIRGVRAAWFYWDDRLELYTRTTTIAVFGTKRSVIRKAAKRVHVVPSYNLPPRHGTRHRFRREPHPRRHYGRLPRASRRAMRSKKTCG